jgi:hypothetical protein
MLVSPAASEAAADTTPATARSRRSVRRPPASAPPGPAPGETTDEESGRPLRRWSDPRKARQRGSPGRTATAGYIAQQHRATPELLINIEPGPRPVRRGAGPGLLQPTSSRPSPPQVPRAYRPGYSESDLTSDDSAIVQRPPTALFPDPLLAAAGSEASQPQSLAWDGYDSGPSFHLC